jgi:hypothetical protein
VYFAVQASVSLAEYGLLLGACTKKSSQRFFCAPTWIEPNNGGLYAILSQDFTEVAQDAQLECKQRAFSI